MLVSLLAAYSFTSLSPLWEIGVADRDDREFALAPAGYRKYDRDPVYLVGSSSAKDLPYVHPGPIDSWAGGRHHVFTIVFGASHTAGQRSRLVLELVDAQNEWPPTLAVTLNGTSERVWSKPGRGDASVFGDPTKGSPQKLELSFPAGSLRDGLNILRIDNDRYSWLIYDHIAFEAGTSVAERLTQPMLLGSATSPALIDRRGASLVQPVDVDVLNPTQPMTVSVGVGPVRQETNLASGVNHIRRWVTAGAKRSIKVTLYDGQTALGFQEVQVQMPRRWTVYFIPHTHVDVGYTEPQPQVEKKQWKTLYDALNLIDKTAHYPQGSRFKWQLEGLWPVESWLKQASQSDRERLFRAIDRGAIGTSATYANELTGLCNEVELHRWAAYGRALFDRPVDSAIISDVPGYAWGVVPALADAGAKYFSFGMNDSARLGTALSAWGDRPFYWQEPDGKRRILCWSAGKGYPWFHRLDISRDLPAALFGYLKELEDDKLPYDVIHIPYTKGDNGGPDPALPEFVRTWNAEHAYPHLVIATVSQSMHELERRYGPKIPVVTGDFTPYWEDGAASSAKETGMARNASNRLIQAEALWRMLGKAQDSRFRDAWRNVLLFNEHTWGAYNSISEPENSGVLEQWRIKRSFAEAGSAQAKSLVALVPPGKVANTLPWDRTAVVSVPQKASNGQKLGDGGYAVRLRVPPSRIVPIRPTAASGRVKMGVNWIENGRVRVEIDEATGGIRHLVFAGHDFASARGLNAYLYVKGTDPRSANSSSDVKIESGEHGPIVGSLVVTSRAPGCRSLRREVRLYADSDEVDILNTVDKEKVLDKEGVHFLYAFNVPKGLMRLNVPGAVIRPEINQIAGSCKNWFSIERWADVSNSTYGITWVTVDAPLAEVGGITAETPWIQHLRSSTTLASYVMNNYWFTNYRAYQEGPVTFRYALLPHGPFSREMSDRFALGVTQPLLVGR